MARREFTPKTKIAIIKRSMVNGVPTCEWVEPETKVRCACAKKLAVHHIDQDAMQVDKSKKLTPADGTNLCPTHHDPITKKQAGEFSKVKRQEAKHLGVKNKPTIAQRPKPSPPTSKLDQIRALPRRWM